MLAQGSEQLSRTPAGQHRGAKRLLLARSLLLSALQPCLSEVHGWTRQGRDWGAGGRRRETGRDGS